MEKKKNNYIIYFLSAFLIIIFLIAGYKNLQNHRDKEYLVLYNRIKEKAKECYQKEECSGEISLKDLYDKKYLETLYDPISKEKLDDNMCIKFENNKIDFCNKT